MVRSNGIEVKIVRHRNHRPYKEYALPSKKPGVAGDTYIEAVDGQRWAVEVNPDPDFDLMGQDGIHVLCRFDDQFDQDSFLAATAMQDPSAPLDQRRAFFEKGEWPVDGVWKGGGFVFEPLKIDDIARPTRKQRQEDRGRIIVEIRRGSYEEVPSISWSGEIEAKDTVSASREVVQEHNNSHAFKHSNLGDCEAPTNDWIFRKAYGPASKTIRFVYRYRSHSALQNLLVIPPSDAGTGLLDDQLPANDEGPVPVTLRPRPPKSKKRKAGATKQQAPARPRNVDTESNIKREYQTDDDDDVQFIGTQEATGSRIRRSPTAASNGVDPPMPAEEERGEAWRRLRLEELEKQAREILTEREALMREMGKTE